VSLIPPFVALRLRRETQGEHVGDVTYERDVLERVAEAFGLDWPRLSEDDTGGLIIAWYVAARQAGEPPDPVAEELIEEVRIEDAYGQHTSEQPGRA
jgi:hypothetical protein